MSQADLEDLKTFYELSDCNSMKEAARRLGISQPALTKRLGRLRAEYDVDLFISGKRPLKLTKAGMYLRQNADRILQMYTRLREKMSSFADSETGLVSIGYTDFIPLSPLVPVIRGFSVMYPDIKLELRRLDAKDLADAMSDDPADMFLTSESGAGRYLTSISAVHSDRWGILVPKGLDEASKTYLTPKDLDGMPLIIPQQTSPAGEIMESLSQNGCRPCVIHSSPSFDASMAYAEAQVGLAFIPMDYKERTDPSMFVLLPYSPAILIRSVLAVRSGDLMTPAAELFADYMKKNFR